MPKFLTVDEAATLLKVKRQTIYKWICEKRIPSFAVGGRTLFDEAELVDWVRSGRRKTIGSGI
jgi:excisionase family DNA binding protein